ncbi:MAG: hypothetical protein IPK58_17010 [Acidobacteria bacterium]|nr:hypothetical protein [Acidobacteriota bacterium]
MKIGWYQYFGPGVPHPTIRYRRWYRLDAIETRFGIPGLEPLEFWNLEFGSGILESRNPGIYWRSWNPGILEWNPEILKVMNTEDVTIVFHGFLNLTGKEKLRLVEAINEYFDSNEREPIRAENEVEFAKIDLAGKKCKCCGR